MKKLIALFGRRKKPPMIGHIGHLHDSNEDILRIIKFYNHGTIKTINDDIAMNSKKYPYLLKYRSSNLYVFITAAISIISSVYMNYAISSMTPHVIANQIRSQQEQASQDDGIYYVSSCFYFSGLLGGSFFFGWTGCLFRQRKSLLITASSSLLIASGAFALSTAYWMLFPVKFLQGVSNASLWIMSTAITADAWPLSKWGSMIGFIGGLFPLGATIAINSVGALSRYVNYYVSFYTALGLCSIAWIMQIFVVERSAIPETWLEPKSPIIPDEPKKQEYQHRETLHVMEGGSWSKSSSLSTINLRDQPIILEKEKEAEQPRDNIYNSALFRIVTFIPVLSLFYQLIVISTILQTLKYTLLEKLEMQMHIDNPTYQNIIVSTFLLPFSVSAFINGWLCDKFGSKIVGLTSVIISIPTLIWIGVPDQNIQSIVAALAMSGTTLGGMSISTYVSTTKAIQKIQLENQHDLTKTQQQSLHREQSTLIFAFICMSFGIGSLSSYFAAELSKIIGFLWLCFSLAMILATCIPLMAYFLKSKVKNSSQLNLKKSIVHNTRPKSFAESCDSDDESTLGSSVRSECNDSKAIVVP